MNIGLTYKVSIEAVMMITEFLGGWSSDGITAGVVTSVEPGT
jgi:NADH:ubiquinone oxidoreductase subunit H